ncbi:MAG: DUF1893 domain-containing protein [Candidatus Bathyarchaeota archaeon]|nr:DUF1893 domain-containing protein [Candidatus Bathyarchaeota archaeon]
MSIKEDLEIAKNELRRKNLTLVIVKDSKVLFESKAHGVSAFLEALEKLRVQMEKASIADKVVGKAIALLSVYAGIKAVYAAILSLEARGVFEKHGVYLEWAKIVDKILDASGTDVCPFEKAAVKIENPKEAYGKFKALIKTFQNGNKTHGQQTRRIYIREE